MEDPTRILRLARYQARLGFEVEPRTLELARASLSQGALGTVSGVRVASELWLFTEEAGTEGFTALGDLGVLEALGLPARFDRELHAEASWLMPEDGIFEALDLCVLFHPAGGGAPPTVESAERLMESFEFIAELRTRLLGGAFGVEQIASQIEAGTRPSDLRRLLAGRPPEGVAIIGALTARRSPAGGRAVARWLSELRHVALEIDGRDLLAAGVPEGPEIGLRLERALSMRLDGQIPHGRDAELRAALEAEL